MSDAAEGTLWYRFRARGVGGEFRVIRDYSPIRTLVWTTIEQEGIYEVEVSVRNLDNEDTGTAAAIFEMTSRVNGAEPVITPTHHPLVFLYSAPPCPPGSSMSVRFESAAGDSVATPSKACLDNKSMNFYLAGLRPATPYVVRHRWKRAPSLRRGPNSHSLFQSSRCNSQRGSFCSNPLPRRSPVSSCVPR